MGRLFPAEVPYELFKFVPDPDGRKDSHGNAIGELSETPQPMKAIAIYPSGGITGRMMQEPVTVNEADRYVDEMLMLVPDPSVIGDRDEVGVGGRRFEVVGDPMDGDWRNGPWRKQIKYARLLGGMVLIQRVG